MYEALEEGVEEPAADNQETEMPELETAEVIDWKACAVAAEVKGITSPVAWKIQRKESEKVG